LTGDAAFYGESIRKGIDLAIKQVNNRNDIREGKIQIFYEDSKAIPAEGVSAFSKLINIHKVPAVIGDAVSSVTLAIAPIAEKDQVVILSPLSSAPAISKAGDFIFRNVPSDLFGGKIAAHFAVKNQSWITFAILYINNDFGVGLKEVFSNEVDVLGGKILLNEAYEQEASDFRTQLIKIKGLNPDVVFLVGYREVPQILIQAKEMGIKSKFLGTGLLEDQNIIDVAKDAAEGLLFTQLQYSIESSDSNVVDFINSFEREYGSKPNIISAYGYDAMQILNFAMVKSDLTPIDIKEQLYKINGFRGITGEISFDENGDVIQPMGVKIVKNGKFVWFQKEISL